MLLKQKEKSDFFDIVLLQTMQEWEVSPRKQWTKFSDISLCHLGFPDVGTKALEVHQISGYSWEFCLSVSLWEDACQRQPRARG